MREAGEGGKVGISTVLSHYKLFPPICYAPLGRLSINNPFEKAN